MHCHERSVIFTVSFKKIIDCLNILSIRPSMGLTKKINNLHMVLFLKYQFLGVGITLCNKQQTLQVNSKYVYRDQHFNLQNSYVFKMVQERLNYETVLSVTDC